MEILAARVLIRPVDYARTVSFYRDVLELAVYREFPGGTVFFLGGGYLEVSGQAPAAEPDEHVRLWIQVRDLSTTYSTLLDRGATVVRPPRREPWGLDEMWIVDPDGLRVGIVEVPPQHPLRRDTRG